MCHPFMSRESLEMPFSIAMVFSHLSSASSTSDGPLFFLNAHKKNGWDLGGESMVFCTNRESRNLRMIKKLEKERGTSE